MVIFCCTPLKHIILVTRLIKNEDFESNGLTDRTAYVTILHITNDILQENYENIHT